MKKRKIVLSVLTAFSIAFTSISQASVKPLMVNAYNDTSTINTDSYQSEAVEVAYSGTQTTVYGVQAYAGVSGPVWVTGELAAILEDGSSSHSLGSNASDGRSNLKITFKVNSTIAGQAYLGVFVKNDNDNSHATFTVNGGSATAVNFKELTNAEYNQTIAAMLPVTLVEGVNVIELTMQENYTAWFGSFFVSNEARYVSKLEHNETATCNTTAPETEAVSISYDGTATKVYGIQSYAGMSGPAWIVGDVAEVLEDGSTAHSVGSNASDGRSNFKMTFAIDSTIAGQAYLNVYAKIDGHDTSNATLKVNDGSEENINFYDLNNVTWNQSIPTKIPVTLIAGLNTITLTLQENYTLWVGSFSVSPYTTEETYFSYNQITIGMFSSKEGDLGAGGDFVGLNAFDNESDYGKHGSVTYKFTCEEQGDYYLKMNVMAGNDLANRAKFTINGEPYLSNGKEYVSFDTKAGWSGDSSNRFKVSLQEGLNTLVIENYLTSVNASKTAEVERGSEGSVLVSNWWMHTLSIEKVPNMELLLDTSNAQTIYNINREYSSTGLVVSYKEDENVRELTSDEYIIDSSLFNSRMFGTYTISVYKKDDVDVKASYLVTVGDNGQPSEGKVIAYDGTTTGQVYSFYMNAKIEGEGTGDCENRIFWYDSNKILSDGGFVFGSNGVGVYENRQATLTIRINSSVEGDFAFISEITTNDRNNATLNIKVNDEEAYDASLFYASENLPYRFIVSLKQGENVIKLTTNNQYNFWFRNFGLAPLESKKVNETFDAKEGYRYGMSIIDPEESDLYKTTAENGGLTFYYDVEKEGDYVLNLATITDKEKKCDVYVDGVKQEATIVKGTSKVYVTLSAGVHKFYLSTTYGSESDFSLSTVTLSEDIRPESLLLDTSNSNFTIPYDGILDTTTIKVSLKNNDGSIVELARSEFSIVKDENYSATKPGEYTFKVVYKEDEGIFATFKVVVLEKQNNQDSSSSTSVPDSSDSQNSESNSSGGNNNPKGCKGGIATGSSSLLFLILGSIFVLKKKNK